MSSPSLVASHNAASFPAIIVYLTNFILSLSLSSLSLPPSYHHQEQVEIEEAETEKLNTLVGDKLALSAPRSNSRSIVGKKNASRASSVAGGKIARSPSIRGGMDGPAAGEGEL